MACKRKKLTIQQKLTIIHDVEDSRHVKLSEMAKKYELAPSSLFGILKNKDALLNVEASGSTASARKNIRTSTFSDVENVLLKWSHDVRSGNIPVSGNILQEKAQEIALRIGVQNFCASNGWLDRFKKRHNLTLQNVSGESEAVDVETVTYWKSTTLPRLIQDYASRDIFNADETGVFYNLLPGKTYSVKGEKCHGGKKSKDRMTALLCVNSDGSEKLPPLIIGKFKSPRCFKNIKTLPCTYDYNSNSWMTTEIFIRFLRCLNAKMGAAGRKIVLIIDHCPAHPKETQFLRNIKVVFLPPNCISHLQPLDLGIIHSVKAKYRAAIVQKSITFLEKKQVMKLNILQAMHMFVAAWNCVTQQTVLNCFAKAGCAKSTSVAEEDEIFPEEEWRIADVPENLTFEDFVSCDNDVSTSLLEMNVSEMCEIVMKERSEVDGSGDNNHDDEDDDDEETIAPSFAAAMEGLDTVRNYFSTFNVDEAILTNINQLERQLLSLQYAGRRKQTTLLDFLKKE